MATDGSGVDRASTHALSRSVNVRWLVARGRVPGRWRGRPGAALGSDPIFCGPGDGPSRESMKDLLSCAPGSLHLRFLHCWRASIEPSDPRVRAGGLWLYVPARCQMIQPQPVVSARKQFRGFPGPSDLVEAFFSEYGAP